ncbi:MAG TPA: EAL domain-containing protein [Burkholderiales bacterium]|nr:EAL domain-containing protein [Burkholderiales bacterium]
MTALEVVVAGSAAAAATAWLQRRYARRRDDRRRHEHELVLLLGNLAAAANEANTPTEALRASLRLICAHGRWSCGHVVTFVPGTGLASTVGSLWEHDSAGRFAPFAEQMNNYDYSTATGSFLGRCVREQQPVWVNDLSRNAEGLRTRRLLDLGARAGLVFPVSLRRETVAILEFFSDEVREPDTLFLENIANITAQLSRPIERHYNAGSHAQLAAIVDSSEDAVISRDLEYRIVSWNPAAERLFGYTADEATGQDIGILIPPELRDEVGRNRQVLSQGQMLKTYDTVRIAKDGRRIPVSLTLSPIRDEAGRMTGNSLILRDISERRDAEQRIERLTRFYAALNETNEAIMRITERDALFERVCEIAVEKGQLALAWIGLVDWENASVRAAAAAGAEVSYVSGACERITAARLQGDSPTAAALRNNCAVIHNQAPPDAITPWREVSGQHGLRALAVIPLVQSGNAIGALCLYAREWDYFDPELVLLLRKMADNVSFALDNFVREAQRRRAEQRVRHLAHHDVLTTLPNRSLLADRIEVALEQASRRGSQLALLFVDLDRFKLINDSLGHLVGDQALKIVAERLQRCVRASDTVGRHGGDEFLVVLPEIAHVEDAARVAEKIVAEVTGPYFVGEHELATGASVGIAIFPDNATDMVELLRNADAAMYAAKQAGRNCYRFYSESMNARASERLQLEHDLRYAVERGELFLEYQPQIEMATGAVVAIEALARWSHPKLGIVPPDRFIALAEESGLILPIGEWVMREACRQRVAWSALPSAVRMCINVSAIQFRQPDFPELMTDALRAHGLPPGSVELELTESVVMQGAQGVIAALSGLSAQGLTLAIDDFGAGYSSLSYLRHLPIQRLKIDRSFISDLATSDDAVAITRAILSMGHTLGLEVIAEGVETSAQAGLLRAAACDRVQGFLYCRPVSAAALEAWLGARGTPAVKKAHTAERGT